MAAIRIQPGVSWVGAAWVLRGIVRRLQRYGNFPSLERSFAAIEGGWQFLDLSELNEQERAELHRVTPLILQEVKKAGPAALDGPEFYPAFLAAYEELDQLVRNESPR